MNKLITLITIILIGCSIPHNSTPRIVMQTIVIELNSEKYH